MKAAPRTMSSTGILLATAIALVLLVFTGCTTYNPYTECTNLTLAKP